MRCYYNAINFLPNNHERHPIAHPSGRGMVGLWWDQPLIDILPQLLRWHVQYHVVLDCDITALNCIWMFSATVTAVQLQNDNVIPKEKVHNLYIGIPLCQHWTSSISFYQQWSSIHDDNTDNIFIDLFLHTAYAICFQASLTYLVDIDIQSLDIIVRLYPRKLLDMLSSRAEKCNDIHNYHSIIQWLSATQQ